MTYTPPSTPMGARPEQGVVMDTGAGGVTVFKANEPPQSAMSSAPSPEMLARQIEVTDVRIFDHVSPSGTPMQRVWVRIRNNSNYPIKSVSMRIEPFTADGTLTVDAEPTYDMFHRGQDPTQFIQPGQYYNHGEDDGYILIQGKSQQQVATQVRITPIRATTR